MSLPEQFGRYEIISVLGQGAMGLVYKAVDPLIERAVAVKVIQASAGLTAADLERMRARFEQEFRSAGALSHSHIVTVFDVGKEGDLYYIAMEYVEGRSLDNVLEARRVLTFEELGRLATELGGALDYAHAEGVVHRDIKPANVMLTLDGSAKITDFGLAKLEATTLTRTGALVGTPAYMSPEQVNGHSITGRSDQFSLAIVLYQALTGERPFTGDSPHTIMYKIVHDEPVLPRTVNPSLPEPVDRVMARALAKAPDQRHPSCVEFAESLTRALGAPLSDTGVPDPTVVVAADVATITGGLTPADPVVPVATGPGEPAPPPPSGQTASVAAPVAGGLPAWVLGLAVVLPSLALIAVVTWLVISGIGGAPAPPAGNELPLSGGVEQTPQVVDPGPETTAPAGGDAENTAENESDESQAATPEDIQAITDELRGEFQQLAQEVRESHDSPQEQEPAAAAPPREERANRGGDRPADNPPEERTNRGGNRLADIPRPREGVPPELQQMIDSGNVRAGMLVVSSPFAVVLRIAPNDRSVIPPEIQKRIRNAADQEERRRLTAAVMAGFLMPEAEEHRVELPAGKWRVNVMSPPLLLNHARQVVVRAAADTRVEFPTRVVRILIESDPPGARVRVNRLPAIRTPYRGPIVVGDHQFQFVWGDQMSTTRAKIERDGQTVVGRRRQ